MTTRIVLLTIALSFATTFATHASGQKKQPKKEKTVRVLLVLGSPPFHDIRKLPPILLKVIDDNFRYIKVSQLAPPKDKAPNDKAHLAQLKDISKSKFDVVVFYTTGYQLDEDQERALASYVESGGGIVALHGASASFTKSKVWNRLIGATFVGHVPGTHKLDVVVTDRGKKHPIMAGVEPFTIVDEEYNHRFAKVKQLEVLAEFKARPAGSTGTNMNVVWTRTIGKGRVVYNALGHGRDAWQHPAWQKLTIQAILWAAGQPREITIPKQ